MTDKIRVPATGAAEAAPEAIPFRVRVSWGLGSFGTITYLNVVTALVMVYLTTVMKIDPAPPEPSCSTRGSSTPSATP